MKKYHVFIISVLSSLVLTTSCEDPIAVTLEPEDARLIVNALIRVDVEEEFTTSTLAFTTTADFFFQDRLEPACVENLVLENLSNGEQVYYANLSEENSTNYIPVDSNGPEIQQRRIATSFFLDSNAIYKLSFEHEGKAYEAFSNFNISSPITFEETAIVSTTERELTVRFNDIPNEENFYILEFDGRNYLPASDRFFENGEAVIIFNRTFDINESSNSESVRNIGADQNFFTFFNAILDQSDQDDPFVQIPATTVRGNIITLDYGEVSPSPNDFVLGYFSISQVYRDKITIE